MSFERACALSELEEAKPVRTEVEGLDVAVVRVGDDVYAIEDECSHANVALSEGEVEGCQIECWMHGSMFDLRTGKPSGPPATVPVPVFPVRVEGDDVFVDVDSPIGA